MFSDLRQWEKAREYGKHLKQGTKKLIGKWGKDVEEKGEWKEAASLFREAKEYRKAV